MPEVSIIIPVYNNEKYIEKCIHSVLNQTFGELEIIAVNDGSTDESGKILKNLEREDVRIILLEQNNQGVAAARNLGVKKSTGKYITFVDGDDYLKNDYIEKMYDLAEKESLEREIEQGNREKVRLTEEREKFKAAGLELSEKRKMTEIQVENLTAEEASVREKMTVLEENGKNDGIRLKEAQDKGYAERNPEADVEGYDACRKIAILSSLISGQQVDFEDIYTEGITNITKEDMMYAKEMGMTIKLLASSKRDNDHLHAIVAPALLHKEHPLYNVNDVFNAIFVHGNVLGDAMFYGSGAGKLPTASAVVADVVDEAKHLNRNIMTMWKNEKLELLPLDNTSKKFFVRIKGDAEAMKAHLESSFGPISIVKVDGLNGEFGFVTEEMTEGSYKEKSAEFPGIIHMIRIEE